MKKIKEDDLVSLKNCLENWINTDMVKATETYKHWQHDKGSFAFGYYMALKAVLNQITTQY